MVDLTEGYYDTGEMRLHYMEGPRSGPPVVLLHGATGSWAGWNSVLPALVENWHIYACPILLLQADLSKEGCLQEEDLEMVMKNARDARVVRFPGSGHGIHDEQTAEFLAALFSFFKTI